MLDIARNTAKLIELGQDIADDDVVLIEDYAYPIYGVPSDETKQAIRLVARLEGMITDPVYEGKSMQGMIDLVREGLLSQGIEGALRPSRRRAGAQRLRLRFPQRLNRRKRLLQIVAEGARSLRRPAPAGKTT